MNLNLFSAEFIRKIGHKKPPLMKIQKRRFKNFKKIDIIHDQPNLFVNPAWNYGMKLVKSKYYALINDDIFFTKTVSLTSL